MPAIIKNAIKSCNPKRAAANEEQETRNAVLTSLKFR